MKENGKENGDAIYERKWERKWKENGDAIYNDLYGTTLRLNFLLNKTIQSQTDIFKMVIKSVTSFPQFPLHGFVCSGALVLSVGIETASKTVLVFLVAQFVDVKKMVTLFITTYMVRRCD